MDIYGAQVQVRKLLNYVTDLSDTKPRMYKKSKDRLKELADTCNQVVAVISEILQDEVLEDNVDDEFGGSDSSDMESIITSIEDQISELRQFMSSPSSNKTSSNGTSVRKKAFHSYHHCLRSLSKTDMSVVEAERCGKLLWRWFDGRFLNIGQNSTFKYNIKRFPGWIRDIITLYGYHVDLGDVDTFIYEFDSWIDSVKSDDSITYSVPYEVYDFNRFPSSEKMTLTSVVLWDILYEYGLSEICSPTQSEFYPTEDCLYNLASSLHEDVLDRYTNFKYDDSVLSLCSLTLKEGENE